MPLAAVYDDPGARSRSVQSARRCPGNCKWGHKPDRISRQFGLLLLMPSAVAKGFESGEHAADIQEIHRSDHLSLWKLPTIWPRSFMPIAVAIECPRYVNGREVAAGIKKTVAPSSIPVIPDDLTHIVDPIGISFLGGAWVFDLRKCVLGFCRPDYETDGSESRELSKRISRKSACRKSFLKEDEKSQSLIACG